MVGGEGQHRRPRAARRWPFLIVAVALVALLVLGVTLTNQAAAPRHDATPAGATRSTPTPPPVPMPSVSTRPATTPATKPPASPRPTPSATTPARPGTALAALATLPTKGRAPKTGFTRDQFGQSWADVDRNGCDTRNDILRRDLTSVMLKPGTHGCVVLRGTLADPYSGTAIAFTRGVATSRAVQIDHVVAEGDAWQTGAQQLTLAQRTAFANDPLNLLAVAGKLNESKGDGDAASWLPPNKAFRCRYVARQVAVKARHHLWVTPAERDAIARVLATCLAEPLPSA